MNKANKVLFHNAKESVTGCIKLPEEDPKVVDIAIEYMSSQVDYIFNLKPHAHPLKLLTGLYIFADKYLITGLSEKAQSRLYKELFGADWTGEDFLLAVRQIYSMPGRRTFRLRMFFSKRARDRLDELVNEPLFVNIVRDIPEFTACLGSVVRGKSRRRRRSKKGVRMRR